jgi:hypothetical protein
MPPGDDRRSPTWRFAFDLVEPVDASIAALGRKLVDHDFLPDPLAHEAIRALAGRTMPEGSLLLEALDRAEERRLHDEVNAFAAGFFDRDVPARVERHRVLVESCQHHPRLLGRLNALRPEPRASEARDRAERFRADPKLTDADRARALKALARRHPEVVGLQPDYPVRLAKIRRKNPADRIGTKVVAFLGSSGQRPYWILAFVLIGSVSRLFNGFSSPPTAPSSLRTLAKSTHPALDKARMASAGARFLRDEFRLSIQRELTGIGKALDQRQLNRVVAGLPVEEIPMVGDPRALIRDGRWTEAVRDRFIARLKVLLKATNLGLNNLQLDDLAPRCFPEATPPRSP